MGGKEVVQRCLKGQHGYALVALADRPISDYMVRLLFVQLKDLRHRITRCPAHFRVQLVLLICAEHCIQFWELPTHFQKCRIL